MYSVVLMAALTTGPGYCGAGSCGGWTPRICCPATYSCCGMVQFFWLGPAGSSLSPEEARRWNAYVAALDEPDRSNVQDLWNRVDDAGRRALLAQVATMQSAEKDREAEPERTVRQTGKHARRRSDFAGAPLFSSPTR